MPARLAQLPLDNRLLTLGERYFSQVAPTPLREPRLLHANHDLAVELGLDPEELHSQAFLEVFSGNRPLPGGAPIATLYSGHQFGGYAPQLGDGRAILLGQLRDPQGQLRDLQLKGAGPTPYSRFADGRAVIRSSVREYLAGEALHHLGIASTRALSLISAQDPVRRETIEQAAVICRVAPSHLRFGHFEIFYYRQQHEALAPLADYLIAQHFPELLAAADDPAPARYAAWLREVIARTARMIAQWQSVGFCHGVMNTDNMSILGLSLDYGPYGFIDGFNAHHICNHSDHSGRYAFSRQPEIGYWNCSRLLQACLPLLDANPATAVEIAQDLLAHYATVYERSMNALWRGKLGLAVSHEHDADLIDRFLLMLHDTQADFTRSFRLLATVRCEDGGQAGALREEMRDLPRYEAWLTDYQARLRIEQSQDAARAIAMQAANPKYVLRNHLAQAAIEKAEAGDGSEVARLMQLLSRPFDEQPEFESYATEPPPEARHLSLSCSS